ncbi:VanZ family protein [Streptomyces sp. VMFN-G11Ma]|jgi:VanZ family protein|uniref:VanZ family protein n=1 Tax=Streptomyces sp. VMFN-G11Ma TaxID=2135609 RepID=UPI000D4BBC7B|nr:VanZ family protein [Streptomyces sp. VMFN-G11Ma]PTM85818.1 VanZ like protein [Streptomyces sp. VMFN-G11Ma]
MARAALGRRSVFRLRTTKSDKTAKTAKPGRNANSGKNIKSGKAAAKPGRTTAAKSGKKPVPQERHVLAFPVRLLAMVCAFAFMVAFAVVLARLTLQPSPASAALTHTNMHPGSSLRAYLDQPALRDAVKQIGGNVLLGVPFGVLVPVVAPRSRGLLRVLLLTAMVMLLVEFAQGALITGRAFDIDDVILNTTGALIGYVLLGRRMGRAVHARERRA